MLTHRSRRDDRWREESQHVGSRGVYILHMHEFRTKKLLSNTNRRWYVIGESTGQRSNVGCERKKCNSHSTMVVVAVGLQQDVLDAGQVLGVIHAQSTGLLVEKAYERQARNDRRLKGRVRSVEWMNVVFRLLLRCRSAVCSEYRLDTVRRWSSRICGRHWSVSRGCEHCFCRS